MKALWQNTCFSRAPQPKYASSFQAHWRCASCVVAAKLKDKEWGYDWPNKVRWLHLWFWSCHRGTPLDVFFFSIEKYVCFTSPLSPFSHSNSDLYKLYHRSPEMVWCLCFVPTMGVNERELFRWRNVALERILFLPCGLGPVTMVVKTPVRGGFKLDLVEPQSYVDSQDLMKAFWASTHLVGIVTVAFPNKFPLPLKMGRTWVFVATECPWCVHS